MHIFPKIYKAAKIWKNMEKYEKYLKRGSNIYI